MTNRLEQLCLERGLRMSGKRRIILQVLDETRDHPSVEEIYRRVTEHDRRISMATVYRLINFLAQEGIFVRLELGDGKSRYEQAAGEHHEHLVDIETGAVLEFREPGIEDLIQTAAARLGYRVVEYHLELFAQSGAPTAQKPSLFGLRRHGGSKARYRFSSSCRSKSQAAKLLR